MEITLAGKTYQVATNLRVPYEMQKDFGNKPYTTIFAGMQESNLEDQVRIIYTAFRILNPNVMTYREFLELVLNEWTLNNVLVFISDIMQTVTGTKGEDSAEKKVIPEV